METLYIVMPAYNEEANIKKVVEAWYEILNDKNLESRLVIADSGSTDNTHEILSELQLQYDKLVVLSDTRKEHGPKVIALYQYAIKSSADYIFQTDSDGQTNPDEFMEFWKERKQYDGIFGLRKQRGDGFFRLIVEHIVCFILRMTFHVNVPDANAPFRLMRAEVVNKYINRLASDYNIPNIMITTYFAYYKENMKFKNISFKQRQGGKNSINFKKIMIIGWKAIKNFRMLKKEM